MSVFTKTVEGSDQPVLDLTKAPMPTAGTLKARKSLPFQFPKFMGFNVLIMRMVLKGHHQ